MSEDLVLMDDVLMAMADALMEKQPKPFNPVLKFQDRKIEFKLGGKPPREVFYRNTLTFLTKLPPPVPMKACTVKYMCNGNLATIKCHSCSIYDPSGTAFYCHECFQACHPWYRVNHIYSTIEKDESIDHTMKIAHRVAEANRYEKEGKEILEKLRREKPNLQYIGDDERIDKQLRIYGRKAIALEEYITKIRENLQADIQQSDQKGSLVGADFQQKLFLEQTKELTRQSTASTIKSQKSFKLSKGQSFNISNPPSPIVQRTASSSTIKTLSQYSEKQIRAAITAQKIFRSHMSKKMVSSIMTLRIVKIWSPEDGRDFYFDRVNGTSTWTPSKLLRKEDLDYLEYVRTHEAKNQWICKRIIQRKRQGSINESKAIRMLQGFTRCCLARKNLIAVADQQYRRVYDHEFQAYYYANIRNGDTTWQKPSFYLTNEPPLYTPENESKRSPRVNRINTKSTD